MPRGARIACGQRSVPSHSSRNDCRELPAIILELSFESADPRLPCSKSRAVTFEHPERREQVVPRVRERPLALPRCRLKLPLPQLKRLGPHLVLDSDLFEALAGRVVVVLRGLRC